MKIKRVEKIILSFVAICILIGVIWARLNDGSFKHYYVREDHFIEWMQFIGLAAGAFLCYYRTWMLRHKRSVIFLLATVVLGSLFFFGAGEEISWGQRIFGVQSSEFFMKHNAQGETNLHNLVVGGVKINKLVFGLILSIVVGIYFLILPVLYRKCSWCKKWINRLAMPLPTWLHIVSYLLVFGLSELTKSGKRGELLEFGGIWVFFLMLLYPLNREIYYQKEKLD